MTRSPRKSRTASRKTAAASQDQPPRLTEKRDEAVDEQHEALRSHFDNLRAQREKDAAGLSEGDGSDLRWEDPDVEDFAAGDEEQRGELALLHKLPKTPSPEERLADLRQVMKEERTAFKRMNANSAGPGQDAIRACEWLAASSRLLSELVGSMSHFQDGGPGEDFPCEALNRVEKLLETLSVGRLPDPIKAAVSRPGRRQYWPLERRDIAIAVFYIQAAQKGDISDVAYIETVSEAFDVERSTVEKWVKHSDRICANVTRPVVGLLKKRMLQAAERYRCNRIRSNWLRERSNIAIAIFYIEAAKKGDIPDRAYIETVADAFEVDLTFVHEWMRNRNEICANVAHPGVGLLKERMLEAAERYRSKGSAAETT